jgi:DNA repair protein RadC
MKLFELKKIQSDFPTEKITTSNEAQLFIRQFYGDDIEVFESAFILMLNRQNQTIGYAKISQGGIAGTYVDPKIVAKYAIDSLSSGVIFCHNHPSGNPAPSPEDITLSKKLKQGLNLLDINLLDSIILTPTSAYTSLADLGQL